METWAIALIVAGIAFILVVVLLVLLHMLKNSLQRKKGVGWRKTLSPGSSTGSPKSAASRCWSSLTFPRRQKRHRHRRPGAGDLQPCAALPAAPQRVRHHLRRRQKDPTWVSVKTDKENVTLGRTAFGNPLREAQKANDAVRRLLTRHKLGKIQTEYYVVLRRPEGHPVDRAGDAGFKLQNL